jgi:hypothetical protein
MESAKKKPATSSAFVEADERTRTLNLLHGKRVEGSVRTAPE